MTSLYLLRHAKTVAEHPNGDPARPLTIRGAADAAAIGQWMADQGIAPRLILCSTAIRARQTLDLVLPALSGKPQVEVEEALYLASVEALLARLRALPPRAARVLMIGHNPGMHELAALLAAPDDGPLGQRLAEGFPTAALAGLEPADDWPALVPRHARLTAFMTPKLLTHAAD